MKKTSFFTKHWQVLAIVGIIGIILLGFLINNLHHVGIVLGVYDGLTLWLLLMGVGVACVIVGGLALLYYRFYRKTSAVPTLHRWKSICLFGLWILLVGGGGCVLLTTLSLGNYRL